MIYSCISYPGSKRKCVDDLMEKLPDGITDWREPFFGSGSVTLAFLQSPKSKDCKKFLVGDLAPEIWALWAGIQKDANKVGEIAVDWFRKNITLYDEYSAINCDLKELRDIPELHDKVDAEARAFWKWTQEVDCSKLSLEERAARTYLVNKISFSAMGDSGSLSMDRFLKFRLDKVNDMKDVGELLQRVEIVNKPFQYTMADVPEDGGFIFLDPPYMNQEKSGLYGRNGDTHRGFPHQEFADLCKKTKAKWLVTYDDSIGVRKLFKGKGIYITPFKLVYTMAMKASEDALDGEEVLISNYKLAEDEENISLDNFF